MHCIPESHWRRQYDEKSTRRRGAHTAVPQVPQLAELVCKSTQMVPQRSGVGAAQAVSEVSMLLYSSGEMRVTYDMRLQLQLLPLWLLKLGYML